MRMLQKMLIVGAGGFIGANARYWLGGWVQHRYGPAFPYGTFVINVTGCFILGLFATLALSLALRDEWRLFIAIGFVGAYTTFSTFEFETLQMVAQGARWREAAINMAASVIVGFAAAWLGVVAARLLMRGRA